MSGYSNGGQYYNSNHYGGNQYGGQPNSYTISNTGQQDVNRRSSFDTGDDTQTFHQQQQQQPPLLPPAPQTIYGSYSSTYQPQPSYVANAPTNLPYRTLSQNLGGYQHQSGPASHATYNPAQYSMPNPQHYGSAQPIPSVGSFQQPEYTPYTTTQTPSYNPAAYQDQNVNNYASTYNSHLTAASPNANTQYFTTRPHMPYTPAQSYPGAYGHEPVLAMPTASPPPVPPPHQPHASSFSGMSSPSYADPYSRNNTHLGYSASTTAGRTYPTFNHHPSDSVNQYAVSSEPPPANAPNRNSSGRRPQSGSTFDRHPQGRTLPGLPSGSESESEYAPTANAVSDLIDSIDAAMGSSSGQRHSQHTTNQQDSLFSSPSPQLALSPDERPTHNGALIAGYQSLNYGAFSSDSDAEAAAGLAALQAADAQEAAEEARQKSNQYFSDAQLSDRERSDDSDYAHLPIDMSGFSGGYAGTMHYGDEPSPGFQSGSYGTATGNDLNTRMSSVRSSGLSSEGHLSQQSGYASDVVQPFPAVPVENARVDAGGTGGLSEPSMLNRRLSYEDGDESRLMDEYGEAQDGIPDMFYHPGMSPNRPLPPPPASESRSSSSQRLSYSAQSRISAYESSLRLYPTTPDLYSQENLTPSAVPRSTSLLSSRSQPRTDQPMRSKTDADRAKLLKQQQANKFGDIYTPSSTSTDIGTPDLPVIPRKQFDPARLSSESFRKCSEPWAVSSVLDWVRALTIEETDLREAALGEAITALFMSKVPTMTTLEAESLGQKFVQDMLAAGVLVKDEEWVKFTRGSMTGVLFQLTGLGCYSCRVHNQPPNTKGKCYSYHCMRTSKKLDLAQPTSQDSLSWVEFYQITKEDIEKKDKKEVQRQNNLHEVVTSEEKFMFDLDITRHVYRDRIKSAQPPLLSEKRLPGFLKEAFGLLDKVKKTNEDYLLAQLKYRQQEQGPWIHGFSDILREWIRRARPVFVEYASAYPRADAAIRNEERMNREFRAFLENARSAEGTRKLGWDHYLKAPIGRMQRYPLLLAEILKNSTQNNDEKMSLQFAIDEIKAAVHEADSKMGEYEKKIEMETLTKKIRLRPEMQGEIDLALNHLGRVLILRGDLQRQGGKNLTWVTSHTILFDHFLILTKLSSDGRGEYDVSKAPIPMDLLVLESTNDQPVTKSSIRGVTAVAGTSGLRGQGSSDPRLARTTSQASGGALYHTSTGLTSSSASATGTSNPAVTALDQDSKEDKILYPFKIKHLGKPEVYTLYASSAETRQNWCESITTAKTAHAEALHAQNAEPFKLRVLADSVFGADAFAFLPQRVVIRGTPLDRAIREVEQKHQNAGRLGYLSRTPVNCATVFQQPIGRYRCAVGTDSGLFISEYQDPRSWFKSIQMTNVTQVTVLEEFNLLIVLANKVLIAYHLDQVCPVSGPPQPQADASVRRAPQRLSGSKDVSFFVVGKLKDRALVFYQKKEGINSIFKILEPVLQNSATSRSRWLGGSGRRGSTEFFREYDEFYIPTETYSLNIFHSSLAVATKRGMQILTLDKKFTWDVPNLEADSRETQAHLASIAARTKDLKPLGMFRLSEAEFLVAYSECAVYVNKQGDVSRGVIMDFVGRANTACLYYPYLILFNDDFVEIRDAHNGRLKQVIAGRGVTMLDDGGNAQPNAAGQNHTALGGGMNGLATQSASSRTVKVSMQHPEQAKVYVVVELLLVDERH